MARTTILYVSEFAGNAFDGLVPAAYRETAERFPRGGTHLVAGFLSRYTYGGMRPSRLLNYLVVYMKSLVALIRHRPDVVVVDTSPPLIQWWVALFAPLFGTRVLVWLMDYHPEIECRWLARRTACRWLASGLRAIDRRMLQRVSGLVALDPAMADTVTARCPQLPVAVHPTWSEQGAGIYDPVTLNDVPDEFRLVYIGNLGVSHGLDDLERLLVRIRASRKISLLAVGGNTSGRELLRGLADRLGFSCELEDRLPWDTLLHRVNVFRPNYAVVLMDEDKRGLLSPSKYSSYLQAGLPLLYLGPRDTNADIACRQQGAGVAATGAECLAQESMLVAALVDPSVQRRCQAATQAAFETCRRRNARTFVDILHPWIIQYLKR